MDKLRAEAKAKLDALFGTTPIPTDEEDDDDGEAFQVANVESFAQAPADQAPDQTDDGYSADNYDLTAE
jgi:hypothetical protein